VFNEGTQLELRKIGTTPELVASDILTVPDSPPWVQLNFSGVRLGQNSYLELTSLLDGATQRLDAQAMRQWGYRSAYFNGDMVKIDLYAAPADAGVFVEISKVVVGEWGGPLHKSICGVDDRVDSTDPRVGRIVPIGCTGWIVDNGKFVTAGHCLNSSNSQTLEFNVPKSLPDGTWQHPGPEDQYPINQGSFQFTDGGVGNDWGVFLVFDNPQTGLQPIDAQGASFSVRQDLSPATIRITGFGSDSGEDDNTNQTHSGPNDGSSGTTMRYTVDTTGGNSGSPVIDEATDESVGVHTHGGCSSNGHNSGTSLFHASFWNALTGAAPPPCTPKGASCSADSECCEGKCKGKAGARTCK
jgi:hypothetical protein